MWYLFYTNKFNKVNVIEKMKNPNLTYKNAGNSTYINKLPTNNES